MRLREQILPGDVVHAAQQITAHLLQVVDVSALRKHVLKHLLGLVELTLQHVNIRLARHADKVLPGQIVDSADHVTAQLNEVVSVGGLRKLILRAVHDTGEGVVVRPLRVVL
eukprot:scaffold51988_cov59-Phaeocystis_antarctica.AAC.7